MSDFIDTRTHTHTHTHTHIQVTDQQPAYSSGVRVGEGGEKDGKKGGCC